jgi:hypothetical protein
MTKHGMPMSNCAKVTKNYTKISAKFLKKCWEEIQNKGWVNLSLLNIIYLVFGLEGYRKGIG